MHYYTFEGDKGKRLHVQSQIYQILARNASFPVNSFQKLNFCISLFIAKIQVP